jgi:methylated-DNA-[protein]-cysteine S-methyltransferase
VVDDALGQLAEYFEGNRKVLDFPVHTAGTTFQESVWAEIAKIPFGQTVSYADIAVAIGKPLASRAVGGAVGSNPVPLVIGCHRVMGASGRITGYSGGDGIPTKRWLLAHENITSAD